MLNRKTKHPEQFVFTGDDNSCPTEMQLFQYHSETYSETRDVQAEELSQARSADKILWLNLHGISEVETVKAVCRQFSIENLTIQDILDTSQRPKFQVYDHYIFLTLKSALPTTDGFHTEQISFVVGNNFLLSFQEKKADHFEHIRYRIRENSGLVRKKNSDFLLYLMLESVFDNYFKALSDLEVQTEKLKLNDISKDPSPDLLYKLELFRQYIHKARKSILPVKELAIKTEGQFTDLLQKENKKYFAELKDLSLSLTDICEQIELSLDRETNLFFSIQGHRMNQIMKTLTIVAAVFIPLTFIAGIYGMNFDHIPELHWNYGYWGVWLINILIVIWMLIYFRKKHWF